MTKLLTAGAMALIATAAVAQPAPTAPAHTAKAMARGEVQARVRTHFAQMDANKDGAITTAEIAEMQTRHHGMGAMGEHGMAHDGPGAMKMRHGAMRDPAAAFDRLDANKDGSISRDEFAKGREMRIEKRIVMREGGNGANAAPGAMHEMGMRHMGGGGMAGGRMIAMADTNHDGRITLAEAEAMALQHFDKMDANHDGQVTPDERRAGRQMMRQMRMAPKAG